MALTWPPASPRTASRTACGTAAATASPRHRRRSRERSAAPAARGPGQCLRHRGRYRRRDRFVDCAAHRAEDRAVHRGLHGFGDRGPGFRSPRCRAGLQRPFRAEPRAIRAAARREACAVAVRSTTRAARSSSTRASAPAAPAGSHRRRRVSLLGREERREDVRRGGRRRAATPSTFLRPAGQSGSFRREVAVQPTSRRHVPALPVEGSRDAELFGERGACVAPSAGRSRQTSPPRRPPRRGRIHHWRVRVAFCRGFGPAWRRSPATGSTGPEDPAAVDFGYGGACGASPGSSAGLSPRADRRAAPGDRAGATVRAGFMSGVVTTACSLPSAARP